MLDAHITAYTLEIENAVANWLFTQFPTAATYWSIMMVTFWVTWWFRGVLLNHKNKLDKLRTDNDQLKVNQDMFAGNLIQLDKLQTDSDQLKVNQEMFASNLIKLYKLQTDTDQLKVTQDKLQTESDRSKVTQDKLQTDTDHLKVNQDKLQTESDRSKVTQEMLAANLIKSEKDQAEFRIEMTKVNDRLTASQVEFRIEMTKANDRLTASQMETRRTFAELRAAIADLRTSLAEVKKDLVGLGRRVSRIDTQLHELIVYLKSTKKIPVNMFNSRSPIELTEAAFKILIEMGGQKFVDDHAEELVSRIEKRNFKSGLDIQDYCFVLLNDRTRHNDFIPIKDFIFIRPTYKISENESVPLDLTLAISIMAIYLRNKYFEKHPELSGRTRSSPNQTN